VNTATALRLLRRLDVPVVSTSDAAVLLDLSPGTASKTLQRLAAAELIRPLRQGLWSLDPAIDPYLVAGYLVAPYPAYISLWSALYLRGVVDQIPSSIFVVSLARTQQIRTSVGAYSIHHLAPGLFGGFEIQQRTPVRLATAEKALFDLAYLSSTRSRHFASTPELDLPAKFRWTVVYGWVGRIEAPVVATRVRRRIEDLRSRIQIGASQERGAQRGAQRLRRTSRRS
jgi:predicted transcriptional regulator of viral defense system